MLTSLFGELGPRRLPTELGNGEESATRVVDSDVVVGNDVAQSMRSHLAATRTDLDQASSMITLLDPSGLWAPQVIRALADASDEKVERLNLRELGTLRTRAVIERTSVRRQRAGALKVYHADTRIGGPGQQDLANVLAEASHLTAIIVGNLAPHAVTDLLRELLLATRQPEWHCPWLVFILPPGVGALRRRILEQDWPRHVRTAAMPESLSGPASVWNAVLTAWEAAAHAPPAGQPAPPQAEPATGQRDSASEAPQWLTRAMLDVARLEGVHGVGIADLDAGDLMAIEAREEDRIELCRLAPALCAARRALLVAGGPHMPVPDEVLVTSGTRQALLRPMVGSEILAWIVLVDRTRAKMALLRYRMLEAERSMC